MKVFVYFNLHRKCWSIKALEGPRKGRVIAHSSEVLLQDCVFKVSEAGRQRVLRERKKNVHAGVVGTMTRWSQWPHNELPWVAVIYNPYRYSTFVNKRTERPVKTAKLVHMLPEGVAGGGVA